MRVLNLHDISFPMQTKQIAKCEQQNPFVSINVLHYDTESHEFFVEYLSKEKQREKHVNLLLLEGDEGKRHHVCITSMSTSS